MLALARRGRCCRPTRLAVAAAASLPLGLDHLLDRVLVLLLDAARTDLRFLVP
jgi:hypothetical protein